MVKADQKMLADNRVRQYVYLTIALFFGYLFLKPAKWEGTKDLHTIMEVAATLLALTVGIIALVRYYTRKNNTILFIATGFLGTAALDLYHTVVTSNYFDQLMPSPPASLLPWSWAASRIFLSVSLFSSWWAWRQEKVHGDAGKIGEKIIYSWNFVFCASCFAFFIFYPLPRAYYPELIFGRPEEFIPAYFFMLALIGYLCKGEWKKDTVEHWMVLCLIVGFMGQAMFMSTSYKIFDTMFDAAHMLKKLSYTFVLTGLLISIYKTFKEIEDLAGHLEIKVRDSSEQLIEAQLKLVRQEKLAAMGKLAGIIGHEIRGPLGVIRNSAYFLNMKLEKDKDEKIKKHLGILEEEVIIANRIIEDTLDFARQKEPDLAPADVSSVIKKALKRQDLPAGIHLKKQFNPGLPLVNVDTTQIVRVFYNIIWNAVEAMEGDGNLTISARQEGGFVEVAFSDNGKGLAVHEMGKIFEPLYTTKPSGTGLGLSVCQNIIKIHGGTLDVESKAGEGAKFIVSLPVKT